MRSDKVQVLVEIALAVALAAVLNWFGVRLPWNIAGGRVSLDMLPIIVVALRRGLWPGIAAGALWGLADLLFDPYVVHPVQLLLDYPVAFALCGLAGLGAHRTAFGLPLRGAALAAPAVVLWSVLGGVGRFSAHFISGIIFFSASAPAGQPVWLYSAVYNLSYLAPSIVACAALAAVIVPALDRAVPSLRTHDV